MQGVAVGQTTYDALLVDERLNHGVIPVTTGPGAGTTWAGTDSPPGTQIGIHTTQLVGIGGTAVHDFNLKVHGSASVGLATIGIATFGGTYETTRSNDKILSPTNNDVALTEIGGNGPAHNLECQPLPFKSLWKATCCLSMLSESDPQISPCILVDKDPQPSYNKQVIKRTPCKTST